MAWAEHKGTGGNGRANPTIIDELTAGLDAGTEKGVGGASDAHAFGSGGIDQGAAIGQTNGQGFFIVDMLAGGHGLEGHLGMGCRDGQIDDDVDVGAARSSATLIAVMPYSAARA